MQILCYLNLFLYVSIAQCMHTIADYHKLYDHLPTHIWITDNAGIVIFLNKCYQDFVGISNIHETSWTDFLHPEDYGSMIAQRSIAIKEKSIFHTQYRLRCAKGNYKWFLSKASPTYDSAGEVIRWFGVNSDINDEVEAIDREKRQNVFFASSVHELKTPLAGIIGLTEMLLQTELHDEQRADLDAILQCGTNVISLTANLLDFCKLESNKLTLEIAPFSLELLLRHLVKMTKLMKNQEISLRVSEELREPHLIEGDYGRINQIFTNIVTNAAKFTPPDGTIQIDVRVGPTETDSEDIVLDGHNNVLVHCRVIDSGIGIDPESLPNLFKPFSQNRNSRNSGIKGHGLGLFITKNLIRLMDGQIKVQSDESGTTITFTLPYRPYAERKLSNAFSQHNSMRESETALDTLGPPLTIMIVEDNHITRNIVKRILEKHNMKVYAVANGQSAIDAYTNLSLELDAILLDLYLPDMSGVDVLHQIREMQALTLNDNVSYLKPAPVVIAFTASGESETISSVFDGVIYKPFRQDDFMVKLRQFIGRP
jgi:PAS domain S-box-containing protein